MKRSQLLLRLALAFVFLYAAVSSLVSPNDWIGYLPRFAREAVPAELLLKLLAGYEILLAVWLIVGKYIRYAAALSALTLAGITLANLQIFTVTFRDVGLLLTALALYFES